MSVTQDIIFDVDGQSVSYVVPEGRPSSVDSVEVYWHRDKDDDTKEGAISGSGSVNAVDTSVSSSSGASESNPRRIELSSTSDIEVGEEYLVENTSGTSEWVEVTGSDSNGVDVRYPLSHDYAAGSTFRGTKISATIDSTWVSDKDHLPDVGLSPRPDYRVRWKYTVDSKSYAKDTYFRLGRYAGRHGVRVIDVAQRSTSFALDQQRYEDNGERFIESGYERVRADLYANNLGEAYLRDREVTWELTIRAAILNHQLDKIYMGGGSADAVTVSQDEYNNHLNRVIQVKLHAPADANADGSAQRPRTQSLWQPR